MLICDRYLEDYAKKGGRDFGAVAFHLMIKANHQNPIIYNFKYASHAKKYGISESAIRRYVSILTNDGIAFWNNKHIQFLGTDKIKAIYETKRICHIDISKSDTINDIKDKIRVLIIRENQFKQDSIINKGKRKNLGTRKSMSCRNETLNNVVHLSLEGVGWLLGLNKCGAQNFIEKAKAKGLLKSKMVYKLITGVKSDFNIHEFRKIYDDGFYFVRNQKLYRHFGQKYDCITDSEKSFKTSKVSMN